MWSPAAINPAKITILAGKLSGNLGFGIFLRFLSSGSVFFGLILIGRQAIEANKGNFNGGSETRGPKLNENRRSL